MLTDATTGVDGRAPGSSPVWLSVTALAGQRKTSKQAISKRLSSLANRGVPVETRKEGRELLVNVVSFDRAVGATEDPAQALRNGQADAAPPPPATTGGGTDHEPSSPSYTAARAARESYQAENARLDLEERIGRLIDRDEAERRTFTVFRRVRDGILSIAAVAAERIAAAPDSRAVRAILDEEIRRTLDRLAAELDRADDDDADAA